LFVNPKFKLYILIFKAKALEAFILELAEKVVKVAVEENTNKLMPYHLYVLLLFIFIVFKKKSF